ncbi:MAG: hypothetical protein GXP54_06860 [Deltaproteobacteria bacterium]|nr:hypothetical protein [Deltaproteobacteria bacterium]
MNDAVTYQSGGPDDTGPIRVAFVGVGGHGVVMGARLIAETAVNMGIRVAMSEVHGMAQRGGVVETTMILRGADCGMIGEGRADILLATEPLEALRACHLAAPGSAIVVWMETNPPASDCLLRDTSTYPSRREIIAGLMEKNRRLWVLENNSESDDGHARVHANTALLGAAAKTGVLPFGFDDLSLTISQVLSDGMLESNLASLRFGRQKAICLSKDQKGGTQ